MIIHYVGDIHQPLHSATGLDSYNPKGDRGGNTEYLPSICGAGNLHAVWDSEAYNYCGYPTLVSLTAKVKNSMWRHKIFTFPFTSPNSIFSLSLTKTGFGTRQSLRASTISTRPTLAKSLPVTLLNGPRKACIWPKLTCIQVRISFVIDKLGYTYNKPLSAEYISTMNTLTRSRMMYGARRLADLMV